jgi:molecular chaperone GrpE
MTEEIKEEEQEVQAITITDLELNALKLERDTFKDKYLRALADSENTQKRLYKERQESIQFATQNVIVDFLTPLDNLENALSHTEKSSKEVQHWAQGFHMILAQFKEVLTSHGVRSVSSLGEMFDPHRHEAIEMVETDDAAPGTIVLESLKGYKIGEKMMRPARVKVAKAPSIKKDENNKESNNE